MLHDRSGSVKENGPSQRATSAYLDNLRRLASHASASVGPRDLAAVSDRSETGRIGVKGITSCRSGGRGRLHLMLEPDAAILPQAQTACRPRRVRDKARRLVSTRS